MILLVGLHVGKTRSGLSLHHIRNFSLPYSVDPSDDAADLLGETFGRLLFIGVDHHLKIKIYSRHFSMIR
jgi:hypothetical protein